MLIHSDWHNHSAASYDSSLALDTLAQAAETYSFRKIGITDHLNYNDTAFIADLDNSAASVKAAQETYPKLVLGVELTPIAKPHFDYIAKTHNREGFVPPVSAEPYDIELGLTKAELMARGVRYAIGASHWRVDIPDMYNAVPELYADMKEWYRQQIWLACDERVTVLGHPWYHPYGLWYEDFSVIPRTMNEEIGAVLKQNGKYVECNSGFLRETAAPEKSLHKYVEMLREWFEMGIPVVHGSDSHSVYNGDHLFAEPYLEAAGFRDGDIVEIAEKDFWI